MYRQLVFLSCFVLLLALAGTNVASGVMIWDGKITDGGDDIEGIVIAEMGDPDDFPFQMILPARQCHPHVVAEEFYQLLAVHPRRVRPNMVNI